MRFLQRKRRYFFYLLLLTLLAACQPSNQPRFSDEAALQVTVSILPQAYFVERIAGDLITVNVMVGPGEEAHTYEPKPEQMKSLTQSQILFTIGLEYEKVWVPRFQDINPGLEIIDSSKGIRRIPLSTVSAHDDDGELHDEEDLEGGLDPHVWLSPDNGRVIAENVFLALSELAPQHAEIFQQNYDILINEIDDLDARIETALGDLEGRKFMVFHPAWGYFAKQYNLEQIPVQVGGQDPSASELAALIKIAEEENIKVIFVQPTFSTANAESIAKEINARVALVDPLAKDWLSNLEAAAEAFASALKD
ncbi:MAG: zinc ABC transporter substrate-binding protein [Chloroflexota bacterium]|nr:zinc ABC transporter substrate-binding protein [Chloroflexota bacterium]